MRLIDAKKLRSAVHDIGGCDAKPDTWCDGWDKAIDTVIDLIDSAPTVDAEPRIHARWEICCDGYYPYCSNCYNEPPGREMTDYCPKCGARMDGKGGAKDDQ